jgi:hypothetical protein
MNETVQAVKSFALVLIKVIAGGTMIASDSFLTQEIRSKRPHVERVTWEPFMPIDLLPIVITRSHHCPLAGFLPWLLSPRDVKRNS